MKVLLIYPEVQETFFNFRHALQFVSKRAALPPIGLITVSSMFPEHWEKKLVDMNVETLLDKDIEWADYVFISAMYIQQQSLFEVLDKCQNHDVKIVAGGPLFTHEYLKFPQIDHFILNEAEITLDRFINDLENHINPKRVYTTKEFPDLSSSPVPEYHLLSKSSYVYMNIQFSRGCPYPCEFCEIPALLGKRVRLKPSSQILNEING